MFPTLADLLRYFFGINITLPIQTLGFFMVMAFVLPYFVFVSEFKRKEREGVIHARRQKVVSNIASLILELIINAALGFVAAYKLFGIILNFRFFAHDPITYVLSLQGNLVAGIAGALCWGIWAYRSARKRGGGRLFDEAREVTDHPYQVMPLVVIYGGGMGFIGAKLFSCIENWALFVRDPWHELFNSGGFNYYGGFLFGAGTYFLLGYLRGIKVTHMADVGAPSMMLAYGVGRIGCQLAGDGDWGIVNPNPRPGWLSWLPDWAWSYTYPHNILDAGDRMADCYGTHCYQLPQGVYPTPLYESIICILIFAFLWGIAKYVRVAGMLACLHLMLNGIERFFMEKIRVNPVYTTWGITYTQAEVIAVCLFLIGFICMFFAFYRHAEKKRMLALVKNN